MNVNYGLFPPLDPAVVEGALADFAVRDSERDAEANSENANGRGRSKRSRRRKLPKREKNELLAARALDSLGPYCERVRPSVEGAV